MLDNKSSLCHINVGSCSGLETRSCGKLKHGTHYKKLLRTKLFRCRVAFPHSECTYEALYLDKSLTSLFFPVRNLSQFYIVLFKLYKSQGYNFMDMKGHMSDFGSLARLIKLLMLD